MDIQKITKQSLWIIGAFLVGTQSAFATTLMGKGDANGHEHTGQYLEMGCVSEPLINALKPIDEKLNDWIMQNDASVRFDKISRPFDAKKALNSEEKYQSIAKIQYLPDLYLVSEETPEQCQKDGCQVSLISFSPFLNSHWITFNADHTSYISFENARDHIIKTQNEAEIERMEVQNIHHFGHNYAITIQGARAPKDEVNRIKFGVMLFDIARTPPNELLKPDERNLKWQSPLRYYIMQDNDFKKACANWSFLIE